VGILPRKTPLIFKSSSARGILMDEKPLLVLSGTSRLPCRFRMVGTGDCLAPAGIVRQVGHGCADCKKTDIREDLVVEESRQVLPPIRRKPRPSTMKNNFERTPCEAIAKRPNEIIKEV